MTAGPQFLKTWRGRVVVLLTGCACAIALSNMVVPAANAEHAPTATMIKSVVVTGVAVPAGAPNNPSAVVVANTDFSVTVTFSDAYGHELPLSRTSDATVALTVEPPATGAEPPSEAGSAQFVGKNTLVVPAGAATATASGFRLSPADNRIRIGATVVRDHEDHKDHKDHEDHAKARDDDETIPKAFSAQFDVVLTAFSATNDQKFLSTSGTAAECEPTSVSPYCLDLLLRFGSETGSLLTVGECDSFLGCTSPNQLVVQALAELGPGYSRDKPLVAVFKCDKTVCPQPEDRDHHESTTRHDDAADHESPKFHVFVSLAATGPLAQAPACSAKGVVDYGLDFCVDYRQSKRTKAGDLQLRLLLARDARMSCC